MIFSTSTKAVRGNRQQIGYFKSCNQRCTLQSQLQFHIVCFHSAQDLPCFLTQTVLTSCIKCHWLVVANSYK